MLLAGSINERELQECLYICVAYVQEEAVLHTCSNVFSRLEQVYRRLAWIMLLGAGLLFVAACFAAWISTGARRRTVRARRAE